MANKIEQIASKKKAAQEKQDADVARFAKKVASEVALGLSDSALIGSIAELATSVAEAVVNSNQNLDVSLKDNFSKLLSAVKDNPSNANQVELSKTIGTSLANVEQALTNMVLSPEINLTALSAEELRTELAAIIAKLPDDTVKHVAIAYEEKHPGQYVNVRLTDGFDFYRAGGGGGGGSGGLQPLTGYDSITYTPATLTDTYVYKLSGSTVMTIVITYTNSSKAVLSGVTYA